MTSQQVVSGIVSDIKTQERIKRQVEKLGECCKGKAFAQKCDACVDAFCATHRNMHQGEPSPALDIANDDAPAAPQTLNIGTHTHRPFTKPNGMLVRPTCASEGCLAPMARSAHGAKQRLERKAETLKQEVARLEREAKAIERRRVELLEELANSPDPLAPLTQLENEQQAATLAAEEAAWVG